MNSPPEPAATLRDLQAGFAAALRRLDDANDPARDAFARDAVASEGGLSPTARLGVYRNNVRAVFTQALQRTYPVVLRRVGEAYFDRLAAAYRTAHPSRSGDLHWIGAAFPAWLESHLDGSGYEWLADLARLEWACEEALVAAQSPSVPLAALAQVPPEDLGRLQLRLQDSLRTVHSGFPIWSVWKANQPEADGHAVDMSIGSQHVVVCCTVDGLVLHLVPPVQLSFTENLVAGQTLEAALADSELPIEDLPSTLGWLFNEGLVADLVAPAAGDRP